MTSTTRWKAASALFAAIEARFGRLDVVFNNAGVTSGGPIWQNSAKDWDWLLGVNLRGVANGVRSFTPGMPPSDMFWGDRMGTLKDPFGQRWTVATHTKDMTTEEISAAEAAFVASMKK